VLSEGSIVITVFGAIGAIGALANETEFSSGENVGVTTIIRAVGVGSVIGVGYGV
jgi:hypothetical protein